MGIIHYMTIRSFQDIIKKYRSQSFSEHDKGSRFERLMQAFLKTYPVYRGKFSDVWLWNEFPCRGYFGSGSKDTGIDIVARTVDGDFWAVQCKCWDESLYIDKPAVDTFLSTSGKTFTNENGQTVSFALRLWISTTNKWGSEAENTIKNQKPPVIRISLVDLENAPVDWAAIEEGVSGADACQTRKKLMKHQQIALEKCHEHFMGNNRGKLIMACGTGKTFTSLKIAEYETKDKTQGVTLFLVPSIALLGQALREWMAEAEIPIHPICICSDPGVSKKKTSKGDEDDDVYGVVNLALPASTHIPYIVSQFTGAM
jgi:predicted helicase